MQFPNANMFAPGSPASAPAHSYQPFLGKRSRAVVREPVRIQPAPCLEEPKLTRCEGLEYAHLKKEEAREGFKEKRRRELEAMGQGDRTKRRRKNDTSMSENEKYRRRLKMNQDSAAAARHAQEIYVATLEDLVEKFEGEKKKMEMDVGALQNERMVLVRKVAMLQAQVNRSMGAGAGGAQPKMSVAMPSTQGIPTLGNISAAPRLQAPSSAQPITRPAQQMASQAPSIAPPAIAGSSAMMPTSISSISSSVSDSSFPAPTAVENATSTVVPNPNHNPRLARVSPMAVTEEMRTDTSQSASLQGVEQLDTTAEEAAALKKLMADMNDPGLFMSLGIDPLSLDFSNDFIDMHPIA